MLTDALPLLGVNKYCFYDPKFSVYEVCKFIKIVLEVRSWPTQETPEATC